MLLWIGGGIHRVGCGSGTVAIKFEDAQAVTYLCNVYACHMHCEGICVLHIAGGVLNWGVRVVLGCNQIQPGPELF